MKKVINIKADCVTFFEKDIKLPTKLNNLKEVLGEGTIKELPNGKKIYVWEQDGIYVWLDGEEITGVRININNEGFELCNSNFQGQILINNKDFQTLKWKKDKYNIGKEYKNGVFNLFLEENSEFLTIEFEKGKTIEKSNKYEINHIEEPILKFDNFNFKLCVIQELMYRKNLLLPRFDVYEFVEEYEARKIDIDEEGYEPIEEIVDWFKKVEIPVSLAANVEEIIMDGGNEIYMQIIPFWDGEDDYFDIKDITENEIKQFANLKRITLLPSEDNIKLIEKLKQFDIEVDEL